MIARVAAVAAAVLLGAWALWRWVYLPVHCNAAVTDVDARTTMAEETASDYERLVRARRNLEDLAPLRRRCRADVRVFMLAGANEELVGRIEEAERSYEQALRTDQRPEVHAALARVQIRLGRIDAAIENFTAAARFDPNAIIYESEEVRRRVREKIGARR